MENLIYDIIMCIILLLLLHLQVGTNTSPSSTPTNVICYMLFVI